MCANDHRLIVEVHQPLGRSILRYAVGRISDNLSVRWQGANELGSGTYAHVALNDQNTVIEVHERSSFSRKVCYRVGVLNPETDVIDWDEDGTELGWGRYPAVALSNEDIVVVVYESAFPGTYRTFYRIGRIVTNTDGGRKRIGTWTPERRLFHERVNELSLAMNQNGCIVAAGRRRSHQICLSVGNLLRVEDTDTYSINWSAAQTHPHSVGCHPAVSIDEHGYVVLVQQTFLGRQLFYQVGKVNQDQTEIRLGDRRNYDTGCNPTIALCNDHKFVEEHETNFSFPHGNRLFYHVGNIHCINEDNNLHDEEDEEEEGEHQE